MVTSKHKRINPYIAGRFGGIAIILSLFAGWIGINEGEPIALIVALGCAVIALVLLGWRGIIWTILLWGGIYLISLLTE
jgi:hypothetical protein